MLAPCVPLKKIKPIISNCPKGMKVTNCHHPLAFKSCSRRWVTKNTWITERTSNTTQINNKKTENKSITVFSFME